MEYERIAITPDGDALKTKSLLKNNPATINQKPNGIGRNIIMETIKQYLPWIIGVAIVLFVVSRMKTSFVPQTSLVQTPQADPYAQDRSNAFQSLIGLAGIQTQAETERQQTSVAADLAKRTQDLQYALGLKSFEVDTARINASYNSAIQAANLNFLQRDQDRQLQQGAIDRYYSSQNMQSIIGSIGTALQGIFGNRSGNVFGTPKTFPSPGGFF